MFWGCLFSAFNDADGPMTGNHLGLRKNCSGSQEVDQDRPTALGVCLVSMALAANHQMELCFYKGELAHVSFQKLGVRMFFGKWARKILLLVIPCHSTFLGILLCHTLPTGKTVL